MKTVRLGDVCWKIGSGSTPRGGDSVYIDSGVALIRSQNVYNDGFREPGLAFIGEEHAEQLSGVEVRADDVLLNITGDSVARACRAPASVLPARVNQHVAIIRPDPEKLDPRFLHYYLVSPSKQAEMLSLASAGATRNALTKKMVEAFEVPCPPILEQCAIVDVLGSLDDKIEQNRRTGRALERLARAVFKAWFVDFEPVKAKAAGATSFPGMPRDAFAALPARLADSDLGPVPEGWAGAWRRVIDLEKMGWLLIGDGYRAKRSELAASGLPFIRAGNVDGTIETEGAELLGTDAVAKAGVKRSRVWDTVFTSKGTVGRIGLVTPATGDVVYAPQVCFWRSADPRSLSPFLLHLWMRSEEFTRQWMVVKGQTDMADFVSLSDQRGMTMFVPPPGMQRAFNGIVQPLVEFQAQLTAESRKLAALRDYLLPRLLSGKVGVREAATRAAGLV